MSSYFDQVEQTMGDAVQQLAHKPRHVRLRRTARLRGRWGWPSVGVGFASLAALAVAAVVSLSSGTTSAFAGWTAVPARVSAASLAQARKACGNVASTKVLAAESRGPFVAIVFVRSDAPWQCIVQGSHTILRQTTQYPLHVYTTLPANKIAAPSMAEQPYSTSSRAKLAELNKQQLQLIRNRAFRRAHPRQYPQEESKLLNEMSAVETGSASLTSLTGTAGHAVTAVTFVLSDGQRVRATVHNGWYVAWWPGSSKPAGADAVRVEVSTARGTHSSAMEYSPLIERAGSRRCVAGARCSVFAPASVKQGVAPSLAKHFALFRDTRPAPQTEEPGFLRRLQNPGSLENQITAREGLDTAQARLIKLPNGRALWITPGTEGICETLVSGGGAGTGCGQIQTVLQSGLLGTDYQGPGNHRGGTFELDGLVPDGTISVTVRLESGKSFSVAVHNNVVYATFSTAPKSYSFKNAYGSRVTIPA